MIIELISGEHSALLRFSETWAGEGQAFFVASAPFSADAAQVAGDAYIWIAEALRENHLR